MQISRYLLLSLVTTAISFESSALGQNNNSSNTSTSNTKTIEPKPLPTIVIPKVNPNALTPADKNYGGTSIYLIDKKTKKSKEEKLRSGQTKTPQLPKSKKAPSTPPGTMIDSGDDAAGKQLVPKSWKLKNIRFGEEETVIDSASYVPQTASPSIIGIANRTKDTCVIHVGSARSNFMVFTKDGQAVSNDLLGKGNPELTAGAGSVVSTDDGIITLHTGFVVIATGRSGVSVANREIGVSIPANSTVAVEYTPGASLSVYNMDGGTVKARTAANSAQLSQVSPGQKLFLDTNGTNQKAISSSESDEIKNLAASSGLSKLSKTGTGAGRLSSSPVRLIGAEGSEFWVKPDGAIEFATGWIFVDAPPNSEFTNPLGQVKASKNAFVSMEAVPGYFRVACCSGPSALTASTESYRIPLDRGEEVLFCDHMPSDDEVAAGDGILRRGVQAMQEKDGSVIVFDDFSIYSLLYNCQHLKPLRLAQSKTDRKALDSLIAAVAEVQFGTASRGDYTDQPKLGKVTPISENHTKSSRSPLISKK